MIPTERYISIIYMVAFRLVELLAAAGVVFGVARMCVASPDSPIARFVRHPKRVWIGAALFFVPLIGHHLLFYLRITRHSALFEHFGLDLLVSLILSLAYGIVFGLMGCLLASLDINSQRFKELEAFGIAAGLAFLFFATQIISGPFRMYNQWISVSEILGLLVFVTFLVARAFPHKAPEPLPDGTQPIRSKPALALSLAFLPSVLLLLTLPFLNDKLDASYLIGCCVVSVACCFTASFMLFRRGTGLAVFGGIIFLLLNGFVSFLFGCGAILTGAKF